MRSFLALVRKDLKGYFDQPTGYILIVIFVGLLSYLYFRTALLAGEASLRAMFNVLPWLLAVFVPASTMRLLAEEQRDGTLEILLTQPIQGWMVLLAKFTAGLVFVGVGILGTVGVPALLATAGNLDEGAVAAQYLGSLFLTAAFVSIGLLTSSLTRNQIVAFILGLTVNVVLMVMGLEFIALSLPPSISVLLQDLSPLTRFSSMARGVLDLRDVLYFVAIVSTFLSATYLSIRSKTLSHQTPLYRNLQLGVAGLVVASLLVGWFGSAIGVRMDLTEDKLYTLTPATARIVSGLDDLLTIKLFQSKDPPVQVALVQRDVNDFLAELAAKSKGMVKLIRRYPDEDEEARREAQQSGVPAVQFNVQTQKGLEIKEGYLGLTMTYADRREVIPFINSIDGLEYRVASLAYKMVQRDKKTVAFLTGHGEKGPDQGMRTFASLLREQYNVRTLDGSQDQPLDLAGVDVLVIAGPTEAIPPQVEQSIYDYIDRGGKALVMVDWLQVNQRQMVAVANENSWASLPERYGIVVRNNVAVDVNFNETLSFTTPLGSVLLPYPFWPRVQTADSKIAGQVESVVMPWASSVDVGESQVGRVEVIPLLETSPFATVRYDYRNVSPNARLDIVRTELGRRLMAVAVTGGAVDGGVPFRLVVVGDSDWLSDSLVNRNEENVAVGLNLVDWLAQEEALASIRSKVVSIRPLKFASVLHQNLVQYGNIVGVPLLFIAIGLVRYVRRRRLSHRMYGNEE